MSSKPGLSALGLSRRQWLQAGLGLGALAASGTSAAASGSLTFSVTPSAAMSPVLTALLKSLQGRYEHDLGSKALYKVGNFGGVAMESVLRSAADGSAALALASSFMTMTPHLRKLPGIDPIKDFVPIAGFARFALVFAVGPTVPPEVKTMKDYVGWVRQSPMQSSVGSLTPDFLSPRLARWGDVALTSAAYKSQVSIADDLFFGSLPAVWWGDFSLQAAATEGLVRILAVASPQRLPALPDVPTVRELGISDMSGEFSFGVYLGAATPMEKQQSLRKAIQEACATPAMAQALAGANLRPIEQGAGSYADAIAREHAAWGEYFQKNRSAMAS